MKNLQQNLLIVLAVALCALCAWQWYVQTVLHTAGERLQVTIDAQLAEIQAFTNQIKNMDAEIAGLSSRINELKQSALTNDQTISAQKREIARLQAAGAAMSNEIVQYKNIVDQFDAKLKEASEGIKKQNEAIKKLVAERDEAIQKYNDAMKDRNALAEKFNALVERFNKLQNAANSESSK
jgi:chromosome segregation ATPase